MKVRAEYYGQGWYIEQSLAGVHFWHVTEDARCFAGSIAEAETRIIRHPITIGERRQRQSYAALAEAIDRGAEVLDTAATTPTAA